MTDDPKGKGEQYPVSEHVATEALALMGATTRVETAGAEIASTGRMRRHIDRHIDRHMDRHMDRHIDRHMDRHAEYDPTEYEIINALGLDIGDRNIVDNTLDLSDDRDDIGADDGDATEPSEEKIEHTSSLLADLKAKVAYMTREMASLRSDVREILMKLTVIESAFVGDD